MCLIICVAFSVFDPKKYTYIYKYLLEVVEIAICTKYPI